MNFLDLPLMDLHKALVAKKITPLALVKEAIKRRQRKQRQCLRAY